MPTNLAKLGFDELGDQLAGWFDLPRAHPGARPHPVALRRHRRAHPHRGDPPRRSTGGSARWRAEHPDSLLLSVLDVFDLYRRASESVLGDLLADGREEAS